MAPIRRKVSRADAARLEHLWHSLPNDDCDGCDGCGEKCAGDIPMTQWEFEQIQSAVLGSEVAATSPAAAPARGPFAPPCRFRDEDAGRCRIYAARPLICRLFGLVEWLPCPVERWDVRLPDGVEIMRWYAGLGPQPYEHWLHESPQSDHTEA